MQRPIRPTPFGDRLEAERSARGLSVTEFARELDIDHGMLSRYISGSTVPSSPTLRHIAACLNVPTAELESLVVAQDRARRAARRAGAPAEITAADLDDLKRRAAAFDAGRSGPLIDGPPPPTRPRLEPMVVPDDPDEALAARGLRPGMVVWVDPIIVAEPGDLVRVGRGPGARLAVKDGEDGPATGVVRLLQTQL